MKKFFICFAVAFSTLASAQTEIYPRHFELGEVELLDGPLRAAMEVNNDLLMRYDVDRLLTPFVRQSGIAAINSKYANWLVEHPSFSNWGLESWSLEGHVGGHYLTALALAYAATGESKFLERVNYMLGVLDDCQNAFDENTDGLKGFIGGQPINEIWTGLYRKDLTPFKKYGGWVPLYCEHKVVAGLRDAYLYTGSELAKEMYREICDWSVALISNLSEGEVQEVLNWEHGGMNEVLADAYKIFNDRKYLEAAEAYSHQIMVDGMQMVARSFLDGKHANTQVPKYIGFERIYQLGGDDKYGLAAHNFWEDVAMNRTVCIGGNSVSEHFLPSSKSSQYITNLEGPESCNSNNMLKLCELLSDETGDAKYADFYEATMWNHILSTQDPLTGGYVYFTSLRPQSYRIYSTVNEAMWCCVGTGMENHSKYGAFVYTRSEANDTLFVNLFTASRLKSEHFEVLQETKFPYEESTKIRVEKSGKFTLAVRHPAWVEDGFEVCVNGKTESVSVEKGRASYAFITREWKQGDEVSVSLPMGLRYEECPGYSDYIAFKYGPILLAAQTTTTDKSNSDFKFETLQNEYAGDGRMDHSPGARATVVPLSASPLLIGEREKVLERISKTGEPLVFKLNVGAERWKELELVPFYSIHHGRYVCYWYQQTAEAYAKSEMAAADAAEAELAARTIDFVATGEQQSEAGHDAKYSLDSNKGTFNSETFRDAQKGGFVEYTLATRGETENVAVLCRFTSVDAGRTATIFLDGQKIADVLVASSGDSFYNAEFAVPSAMLVGKSSVVVRIEATGETPIPGLYYLRLVLVR